MNKEYTLTKIKKQYFYLLYNSVDEKNNMVIKELFSYKNLIDGYNYDEYDKVLYEEIVNICYSLLQYQLRLINSFIFNDQEDDIRKIYYRLPKNIINIIDKSGFENVQFAKIINTEKISDINLHHLLAYVDEIQNILEMFFEPEKYEEKRKNYLQSEEGKQEAILLEQIKLKMFN